jgi:flagellar basal body-associated protein FliL
LSRPLRSLCLLTLVALLIAVLTAPAAMSSSLEGGSSFSELTQGQTEPTNTSAQTSTSAATTETTNSKTLIILAMVAAVLLLVAIAFVIARDARKVAPAGDPQVAEGVASREWAAKQARRRTKAKAARQQRKRNR